MPIEKEFSNHSNKSLSKRTQMLYQRWLKIFEAKYPQTTPHNALRFLTDIKKAYQPQSCSQARAALKYYFVNIKNEPFSPPSIAKPAKKASSVALNVPDDEVLEQIIERIENKEYQLIFRLSYRTGIRFSDIVTLTVDDIDFDGLVFKKVKRGCNHIPPEFVAELEPFVAQANLVGSPYLFRTQVYPNNRPVRPELLRQILNKTANTLQINPAPEPSFFFVAAIRRFFREGRSLTEARKTFGYKLLGSEERLRQLEAEAKTHGD